MNELTKEEYHKKYVTLLKVTILSEYFRTFLDFFSQTFENWQPIESKEKLQLKAKELLLPLEEALKKESGELTKQIKNKLEFEANIINELDILIAPLNNFIKNEIYE